MKIKTVMVSAFFTFIVPAVIKAQEAGAAAGGTQSSAMPDVITKIVAQISQIGNLFGNTIGFRIGGTTGTAIAAFVIAKILEDKAPSWVKWILYAGGGTMIAGGGANIAQVVMQFLGK